MIKRTLALKQMASPITTQVHFGNQCLYSADWLQTLKSLNKKLVILTDSNLKTAVVDQWADFLKKEGIAPLILSFDAGEESKTRETKAWIEDELFSHQCGKDTAIIAVGGGVVTDLAGFVASTYCRGIPFVSIPTSLLAMCDAVIGGKTGVNTPFGKNLVGTFYPAQHILLDTETLTTLPEKEWRNGLAEVIKHGLICSQALFEKLKSGHALWVRKDPQFLQDLIYDSFLIKKQVVEADFQEKGYRRILNFGHTVGHALELVLNYQIPHGEAVAIGMLCEAQISHRLGHLSSEDYQKVEAILNLYNFPLFLPPKITVEAFRQAMALDKKSKQAKPRFVILNSIGSTVSFDGSYCNSIEDLLLQDILKWAVTHLGDNS